MNRQLWKEESINYISSRQIRFLARMYVPNAYLFLVRFYPL